MPEYGQKWWCKKIKDREAELKKSWWEFGDRIVDRYLDIRGDSVGEDQKRKYNMFWANVEIMKSALYATPPKPSVTRQNGDSKDDVARTAALMLQRILQIGVSKDASDMHAAFKYGVDDRLIPGLGQVWLRYDCDTEPTPEVTDPITGMVLTPAGEKIISEAAPCDYVHWRDFLWSPARVWEEVWWVGRRVWMKRKRFIKRFKQPAYDAIKSNYDNARNKGEDSVLPEGFSQGRVEVFEIWCEDTNKVYFINKYADAILETVDDPLKLDDFFPCPKPLIATHTTNNFMPRADYTMAQDQYHELDVLNDRISILTRALRVVGMYDKEQEGLQNLLSGNEFQMIPVSNWAMLGEKKGLAGVVDWFPIESISKVLGELMIQRQAVIGQIYELTSISDIMRGATSPRETAKAQTLKAQYSSVRLQLTQQDVARWVAHAMMIKAEIVCNHFQPEMIVEQSQIMQTESAKFASEAVKLLKNFRRAQYRIEVGEESLSMADYNAERELRTEYLTAVGQFLSQAAVLLQGKPEALPYLLRMVQWVTASFRGSSDIESVLDEAVQAATQPVAPQPDPKAAAEQAKAAAQQQSDQLKVQIAQGQAQVDERIAAADRESNERIAQMNNDTKVLIESMKAQLTEMAEREETSREEMRNLLERVRMASEAIQGAADRKHDLEVIEQTPAPGKGD